MEHTTVLELSSDSEAEDGFNSDVSIATPKQIDTSDSSSNFSDAGFEPRHGPDVVPEEFENDAGNSQMPKIIDLVGDDYSTEDWESVGDSRVGDSVAWMISDESDNDYSVLSKSNSDIDCYYYSSDSADVDPLRLDKSSTFKIR